MARKQGSLWRDLSLGPPRRRDEMPAMLAGSCRRGAGRGLRAGPEGDRPRARTIHLVTAPFPGARRLLYLGPGLVIVIPDQVPKSALSTPLPLHTTIPVLPRL